MIVGGQVPLGVGFELGAKANVGEFGYDAFLQTAISAEFGVDCPAACSIVADVSGTSTGSYFRLLHPASVWSTRVELGLSAFGWAELEIGNPVLSALRFKAVEMKGGLEQKFELASTETQVADPAYASSYALKPVFEAKASSNLTAIGNLLNVNIATLSFAPELPALARSPSGSFTISPATVAPGDGTQLGERATFTVALNDVNYLGAYAVEGVQLRWQKSNGGVVTLEAGRPGCSDLAAAQDQVTFTCETDFLASQTGIQTFRAFVKTRVFGVPIPVPLEIAPDARATVTVGPGTGPGAGIVLVVDRTSPAGAVSARTFFTVAGFVCGKLDTVLTGSLQGSLAARCSNTAVSTAGNAMSANSDATGSYTLTTASGRLATLRADGSASGTATGEAGVGPPTDGALMTASHSFGIFFDVVGSAVNVVLRGTVSSNIPDPSSNATGFAMVSITGPGTSEAFQAGRGLDADPVLPTLAIDRTLRLSPGRYNLILQADARATSDFDHASASAGTGYSLTMSVAP